ncbi:MAG TPA: DUF2490 domain-containing protein [Bacteroidia bacterium]|nr:DUF2490 domain-containing protein [Bacteroidia bacterium]
MRQFFALLFVIFTCAGVHAQNSDFGMWNTLSINKKINDKFSLGIDQEFRLRDNLSTVNLLYTNFGVSYKPTDFLKISLVYRFIDKHKEDLSWGIRHRVFADFVFKVKPGDFTLSYRARFQAEWRGAGYDATYGNVPEIFMRNMIKAAYKEAGDFEPYAGVEVRWQIQNPRIPYHHTIDRGRFFAGVNYEINKRNVIGTYFLVQKEVNVNDRQSLYIWGLEYTINL